MNVDFFKKFWIFFKALPWYAKLISIVGVMALTVGLSVFVSCSSVGSIDWDIVNKKNIA